MKTTPNDLDPDAWIASIEDPTRRELVATLDARVRRQLPGAPRRMWGSILGYGSHHYRYASGREGDWFPVGIANMKGHVGVYLCVADDEGYLAERNAKRLGKVSCGKSCIRVKKLEHVDLDVLDELLAEAARLVESGKFAM